MTGRVDCQVAHCTTFLSSDMTGSFSSLLYSCDHPLSMIAYKFLSLLAKYYFHSRLINGTMSHRSKSVLSNSCLCLNSGAYFSTVMAIFQHPLLLLLSPTCQTLVALGVPRVKIHFLSTSGVVELMYYRNGNWSLLPWPSDNPKGVGPPCRRSKTLG